MYITYESTVDFIKRNLGYPFTTIEIQDSDIEHIIKTISLPYFSQYIPDTNQIVVNKLADNSNNVFVIEDPDNMPVLDVIKVFSDVGTEVMTNDPRVIMPMIGKSSIPDFLTSLTQAKLQQNYSSYWPSWTFIPPNLVRIYPTNMQSSYLIRYTRIHASLSTIPMSYHRDFNDLCLADVMLSLYASRSKYSNYSTPFGEIQLNSDALYQRATEIRDKVSERLKRRPPDTLLYIR